MKESGFAKRLEREEHRGPLDRCSTQPLARHGTMSTAPSPGRHRVCQFAATSLSTRRLRSNSGNVLYDDEAESLTAAEMNSIVPPNPVYKIVLTGGPCGGKTTLLARLSPYLRERGFEVMTCPEAFTLLVMNGMQPGDYFASVDGMPIVVQDSVLDMQVSLEDSLERVLRARGKPAVLLCDRGLLDGKAYMDEGGWQKLLEKRECACESHMREGRYNAVFHLVSAAVSKNYTCIQPMIFSPSM